MKPDYTEMEKQIAVRRESGKLEVLSPVSEIIPGLFQGVRPRTYRGYDLVVSCEEHLAKSPMGSYQGMTIHIPMRDDDEFKIPVRAIKVAVDAVGEMIYAGGKVLVHCTGGLNRSSLVTARYLIENEGTGPMWRMKPADAVTLLRVKRDPYVLCNKAFERWVLGEQLPTAETTTFKEGEE